MYQMDEQVKARELRFSRLSLVRLVLEVEKQVLHHMDIGSNGGETCRDCFEVPNAAPQYSRTRVNQSRYCHNPSFSPPTCGLEEPAASRRA